MRSTSGVGADSGHDLSLSGSGSEMGCRPVRVKFSLGQGSRYCGSPGFAVTAGRCHGRDGFLHISYFQNQLLLFIKGVL